MRVSSQSFFNGLKVNSTHFLKKFKRIGVNSRFYFSNEDLLAIRDKLPVSRYKSAKVVQRAKSLLEDSK